MRRPINEWQAQSRPDVRVKCERRERALHLGVSDKSGWRTRGNSLCQVCARHRPTRVSSALDFFSAVRSRNGTTPPTDAGRGHAARDACLATGPPARSMRRAAAYLPRPKRFSPLGAEWEHGTRQKRPPPRPGVGLLPACSPPRVPSSGRGPPRAFKKREGPGPLRTKSEKSNRATALY